MISFTSDYIAGAHPEIIKRLAETNLETVTSYGFDKYSEHAKKLIKEAVGNENADVYFLTGGTQTNQIVISTMLDSYEGVISAKTGHINGHEAGAIEYSGRKVLEIPGYEGKVRAEDIEDYCARFYGDDNHEHMVMPAMVYISFPTEYGTIYSKSELQAIRNVCDKYKLTLYADGARLGYGLASYDCDVTLKEFAEICDVFYIGGTKVGALCGEALVFTKNNMPAHFLTQVKQHGALLAKGRLIGVQFETLFKDGLYMKIGAYAIEMAEKLKALFENKGYQFFKTSPTNQQFIVLENGKMNELAKNVEFGFWEKYDDNHTVVRFATSWSTTDDDIEKLAKLI